MAIPQKMVLFVSWARLTWSSRGGWATRGCAGSDELMRCATRGSSTPLPSQRDRRPVGGGGNGGGDGSSITDSHPLKTVRYVFPVIRTYTHHSWQSYIPPSRASHRAPATIKTRTRAGPPSAGESRGGGNRGRGAPRRRFHLSPLAQPLSTIAPCLALLPRSIVLLAVARLGVLPLPRAHLLVGGVVNDD